MKRWWDPWEEQERCLCRTIAENYDKKFARDETWSQAGLVLSTYALNYRKLSQRPGGVSKVCLGVSEEKGSCCSVTWNCMESRSYTLRLGRRVIPITVLVGDAS
jgi:hypothetical protein